MNHLDPSDGDHWERRTHLELGVERKVTKQDLVRRAGLVTAVTALVPFPWRQGFQTMFRLHFGSGSATSQNAELRLVTLPQAPRSTLLARVVEVLVQPSTGGHRPDHRSVTSSG